MTLKRSFVVFFFAIIMLPLATAESKIPDEAGTWLSVHFKYPFKGEKADFHGRIGPGFELRKIQLPQAGRPKEDEAKEAAIMVIFPNGDQPKQRTLQNFEFSRFIADWKRIGLMNCDQNVFAKIELMPFDARTLVVTVREGGKVTTISIYAPEFCAEELKDQTEGKALRAALDLLHRIVGEATL